MTLAQLRYLVAVDRRRSFREAAESCHVTQPALSMQVQKLEDSLGVRVFDRSRQPIVPTDIGRRVLEQARVVLRESERMSDVVAATDGELEGRYRLGIIPTLAPSLLPKFLPGFAKRHPRVELVIEELQTSDMVSRLLEDTIDGGIAATPLYENGIKERPLYREPFSVYVSSNHPLAGRATVKQSELVDESVWIMSEGHCFRDQVLHLCKADRPVSTRNGGLVRFESGTFDTLIRLVDAEFGLTVLPELVVRSLPAPKRRARVKRFAAPVPTREVSLIHAREHLHRRIADALETAIAVSVPPELVKAAGRKGGSVIAPVPE